MRINNWVALICLLLLSSCGSQVIQPRDSVHTVIIGVSNPCFEVGSNGGKVYKLCGVNLTTPEKLSYLVGKEAVFSVISDRAEIFLPVGNSGEEELINATAINIGAGKRNKDLCPNGSDF